MEREEGVSLCREEAVCGGGFCRGCGREKVVKEFAVGVELERYFLSLLSHSERAARTAGIGYGSLL